MVFLHQHEIRNRKLVCACGTCRNWIVLGRERFLQRLRSCGEYDVFVLPGGLRAQRRHAIETLLYE